MDTTNITLHWIAHFRGQVNKTEALIQICAYIFIIVQNLVKIGLSAAELLRIFDFQNGGSQLLPNQLAWGPSAVSSPSGVRGAATPRVFLYSVPSDCLSQHLSRGLHVEYRLHGYVLEGLE